MTPKPRLGRAIVNAQAELVARALDGGYCEFYAGEQPADADEAPNPDALLGRCKFAEVSFSEPVDGVIVANKSERAQAIRTGDPSWIRCVSRSGEFVFDGTYSTKNANAVGAVKTVIEGQFIDITGMTYAVPRTF
jgi:hypothetical protein